MYLLHVITCNIINQMFVILAHTHTAGGKTLTMAAEVGRLTRNIRFEGAVYPEIDNEAFGARIMVSRIVENGQLYIGMHCVHKFNIMNSSTFERSVQSWEENGLLVLVL